MRWSTAFGLMLLIAACTSGAEPVPTSTTSSPTTTVGVTTSVAPTTSSEPSTTSSTTTTTSIPDLQGLRYSTVAEGLDFPMLVMPWTDESSLIAFRDGRIHPFDGTAISSDALVDLEVSTGGERGLLGFDTDGESTVYVHYSDPSGDTTVSSIDLTTGAEQVLLRVSQPASNHNGGMLQFGPDGMLYLGLGDGGGANDRFGHGQNTDTLLGSIVRIDPESGAAELWAYGLRNPYRFWIDGELMYIGDVGQNAYEEVDVVSMDGGGYNFGWPITEGLHCFSPASGCDVEGLTLPVLEYEHGDGGACSVTGGVVYRGDAIPELDGHYLYSDYCGGWLRSFFFDGSQSIEPRDWTEDVGVPGPVVSFGVDHNGEVYVLTPDRLLRIEPLR